MTAAPGHGPSASCGGIHCFWGSHPHGTTGTFGLAPHTWCDVGEVPPCHGCVRASFLLVAERCCRLLVHAHADAGTWGWRDLWTTVSKAAAKSSRFSSPEIPPQGGLAGGGTAMFAFLRKQQPGFRSSCTSQVLLSGSPLPGSRTCPAPWGGGPGDVVGRGTGTRGHPSSFSPPTVGLPSESYQEAEAGEPAQGRPATVAESGPPETCALACTLGVGGGGAAGASTSLPVDAHATPASPGCSDLPTPPHPGRSSS